MEEKFNKEIENKVNKTEIKSERTKIKKIINQSEMKK